MDSTRALHGQDAPPDAEVSAERSVGRAHVVDVSRVVKAFRRSEGRFRLFRDKPSRQLLAVDRVSLHVQEDEIVGLVGESGSGKTTLGKAMLRLYDIDAGQILLDGADIHRLDNETLRRLRPKYQMIFQNPHSSLNPGMRVHDMLRETVSLHLHLKGQEAEDRISEMLQVVQLSDKAYAFPSQLSGGERRRVGLARTLLLSPRLIVADEPTAGLDASLKAGIVHLMLRTRLAGMAYLFISHDLHLIRYVSDRVLVMYHGRIVEEAPRGGFALDRAHHPYTETLLLSLEAQRRQGTTEIARTPEAAKRLSLPETRGCCYYHQCARAKALGATAELCRTTEPELLPRAGEGAIACHFV